VVPLFISSKFSQRKIGTVGQGTRTSGVEVRVKLQ